MTDRCEALEKAAADGHGCGSEWSQAHHSKRHAEDADRAGPVSATERPACVRAGSFDPGMRSALPSVGSIAQAGAFGAALGGISTGVSELARAKRGETTLDEAMANVAKSSAQGATTMAVASVAAHVVRSHPMFSFIALAAAGIGALTMLSGTSPGKGTGGAGGNRRPTKPKATSPAKPVPVSEAAPSAEPSATPAS
jgi:hypothetical protein